MPVTLKQTHLLPIVLVLKLFEWVHTTEYPPLNTQNREHDLKENLKIHRPLSPCDRRKDYMLVKIGSREGARVVETGRFTPSTWEQPRAARAIVALLVYGGESIF